MARFPLVLAALAIALMAPTTSAYDMASAKSIEKQCKAIATCLKGGPNLNAPCEIKYGNCPACVTFNDNGCYDKPKGGTCSFGEDCSQWFENPDGSSTSSASKDAGTPTTAPTSGSKSTNGTSSNSTSTHTPSPSDTSSSSSSGGGSTVLIFGIIGGVIVIVAVGVIFFALIRRSRAGGDDDDEENMTPTAAVMTKVDKGPSTSTNAVNYAPYAQRSGANPTTPTNRVIQYYNDNALPSPHGGRGGGGFGSQPTNQQPPVKTVRPAVAANAPTFFKPNAAPTAYTAQAVAQPAPAYNAQPAPAYNAQPVYAKQTSSQSSYMPTQPTQTQTQPSYTPAPVYNPTPAPTYAAPAPPQPTYAPPPTAEPLFTVHAEDEPHLPRRESSPRPRRESYEF